MVQVEAPVASSLSRMLPSKAAVSDSILASTLETANHDVTASSGKAQPTMKLKGGLTLVFDPGMEGPEEECMEEKRASLLRYQKMLQRAGAS